MVLKTIHSNYPEELDCMTQKTCSWVGVDQNGRVEIIANDQGNRTTPSYVASQRTSG